jgi:hypothetical protein
MHPARPADGASNVQGLQPVNGAVMLDQATLDAYEARLEAQGVPILDAGKPGLSELEMRDLVAPLGLELPTEGRLWWGWRNGSPRSMNKKPLTPVGNECLTLAQAVDTYRQYRKLVEENVEPDRPPLDEPNFRWDPSWLPITGFQLPIVIDCSVSERQPTPVRMLSMEEPLFSREPRAASLGQMVRWWIGALDSGAWRWHPEQGEWTTDVRLLDEEFRMSGLT